MALLPSSSSSSSSITYAFTYDVFLSFRGYDTRHGFTGNLYKALDDKGIRTFIDDEELQKGDEINPALEDAIEKSRIAIVVLSKNYASSSFCLHELSKILECFKENCRFVWPVFYDVDPSDGRKQTGTYGEAMNLHMERFKDNEEKLLKWRTALKQVADLSGWHYKHGDEYEHKFIEKIVEEVSKKINRVALPIADYPVGLESQVHRVIMLLDVGSDDRVHMVGIHGIGGIGKTTLAVAVYNSIADHFEGSCFLENVRENYEKHGLLYLQEIILSDVLGEKKNTLTSEKQGVSIIQHRLRQKKVLLILDDVDKEEQLQGIVGRHDWLHPGSRVIIITRDKHLLACHEVKRTYEVEGLKEKDAFKLLRWKAFKNDKVSPSYVDILNRVVTYASGLPLALEVIGSNLYGKSIQEWLAAFEKYEMIPDKKIQKILEVSFDALEEEEKSVFLDIACCFKGFQFKEVKNILNAHHDQCMTYQIGVLVDKSLIKITDNGFDFVELHDLVEDMGKEIVRQESPKEPGNRSRLWSRKDIFEVLEENTGTRKIEMIHLDYPSSEEVDWDGEAFKEMKKLKTLIIRESHFSKGPMYLPNSLRVLEWWNYPLQHFPCDFHPKKLSICKLPHNSFKSLEFVSSSKKFVTMKVLNLENCQYLTHTSDLSGLVNLEELSFRDCSKLITIDNSIGLLDKLKILNASECNQLKNLPSLKLPSLEELDLSLCSRIESFPEILGKMENITTLNLSHTKIKEFPSSFRNLTRLRTLEVGHLLPPRSIVMIPQVAELRVVAWVLSGTFKIEDVSEEKVSSMLLSSNVECLIIGQWALSREYLVLIPSLFPHLKELVITEGYFRILPECIKECRFLWKLELYESKQLREIEGIPPSLKYLCIIRCPSLSFSCRSILVKQELHEAGDTHFVLPNLETRRIPEWFEHQSRGSLSFWFRNKFPRILLSLVSAPLVGKYDYHEVVFTVNGMGFPYFSTLYGGHISLVSVSMQMEKLNYNVDEALLENEWNHAECMIVSKGKYISDSGIGIHVLKENSCMVDISFTDPDRKRKIDWNLAPLQENDVNTELTL